MKACEPVSRLVGTDVEWYNAYEKSMANHKKTFFAFLVLVVILVSGVLVWREVSAPIGDSGTDGGGVASSTGVDPGDKKRFRDNPGEMVLEKKYFFVNAYYPVTGVASVDGSLRKSIDSTINQLERKRESDKATASSGKPTVTIQFSEEEPVRDIRSFLFRVTVREGETESNHGIYTKTYDMKTGGEVTITDIFPEESLSTIANDLRLRLDSVVSPEEKTAVGQMIQPTRRSLQNFTVATDRVIFHFDVIGSPFGFVSIPVPFEAQKESLSFEWYDRLSK